MTDSGRRSMLPVWVPPTLDAFHDAFCPAAIFASVHATIATVVPVFVPVLVSVPVIADPVFEVSVGIIGFFAHHTTRILVNNHAIRRVFSLDGYLLNINKCIWHPIYIFTEYSMSVPKVVFTSDEDSAYIVFVNYFIFSLVGKQLYSDSNSIRTLCCLGTSPQIRVVVTVPDPRTQILDLSTFLSRSLV